MLCLLTVMFPAWVTSQNTRDKARDVGEIHAWRLRFPITENVLRARHHARATV